MSDTEWAPSARGEAGPPTRSHPRRRWVPLAVLIGVVITQFAWIWGTPPFRGIDEIDHAFRAASVALGDIRSTHLPVDGRGALVEVPPGLAADARAQCESLTYNGTSNCIPEEILPDGNVLIASAAASYSPVFYAVIGTIARPWDGVVALYVMRSSASLISALLLALATWCLMTRSRTSWPLAGLLAGLTPMALYTSMLPAPNGIELAAATVLWCALLGIQGAAARSHGRLLASAALAGGILGSVRPTGPLIALLIVGFVVLVDPRGTRRLVRRRWKGALAGVFATLVGTIYQVDWAVTHPPVSGGGDDSRPFDLGVILEQGVLWIFQWIGAFPFRNQPASPVTYIACGTLILVVFADGVRRGDAKRWAAIAVVVTCMVLPLLCTLVTFTKLGTFWQGRYALPLLIGAPILMGLALDRPEGEARALGFLVPLLGFVGTSAAVIHMVDLELQRPVSAADPHWQAPPADAVVLLAVAAAATFSCALAWAGAGRPPDAFAPGLARRTWRPVQVRTAARAVGPRAWIKRRHMLRRRNWALLMGLALGVAAQPSRYRMAESALQDAAVTR
jgi:predicted membrane protein DUF2142